MAKVARGNKMRVFAEYYPVINLTTNMLEDESNQFNLNFDRALVSRACATGALHYISSVDESAINKDSVYRAAKEAGEIALDGLNTLRGE